MNWYTATWAALTAAFAGTEIAAIANNDWSGTFSVNVRRLFRTHTKFGRRFFLTTWLGFSVWFLGHILEWWS